MKYLNGVRATNDAALIAIQAKTDNLPTDPADESLIEAAITAAHATTDGKIDTIDANVDSILAITGAPVRKVITFADTGADVPVFTVTGGVRVKIIVICTTSLASAAGCTIGLKAGDGELIPATSSTDLIAGEIWNDATPTLMLERYYDAVLDYVIGDGTDISIDVEDAKQVDSGVLAFNLTFEPITADGAVVAAA